MTGPAATARTITASSSSTWRARAIASGRRVCIRTRSCHRCHPQLALRVRKQALRLRTYNRIVRWCREGPRPLPVLAYKMRRAERRLVGFELAAIGNCSYGRRRWRTTAIATGRRADQLNVNKQINAQELVDMLCVASRPVPHRLSPPPIVKPGTKAGSLSSWESDAK